MNPGLRSRSMSKQYMLKEEISNLTKDNFFIPFVAIAESWLKSFIMDAQLSIQNYNIYRSDRKISKNGGTALYVHKDIIIETCSNYDDDICSGIACFSKKNNCFIICVYRPPGSSVQSFSNLVEFVDDFIIQHKNSNKFTIYIFGDFNFPKIDWKHLNSYKQNNPELTHFFKFLDKHFLIQYISENTRNYNMLDLLFSDNPNFVNFIQTEDISYSDHKLIKIYNTFFSPLCKDTTLINNNQTSPDFSKLNLNQTDYAAVNIELSNVNWEHIINAPIDDFPDLLRNVVYNVLLKYSGQKNTNKTKLKNRLSKNITKVNREKSKIFICEI